MIEAYAFLAAFAFQIFIVAVLIPAWFLRYVRTITANIPAERLAQMYPGVDVGVAQGHFTTRYRALTAGMGLVSLLLWAWLFTYLQSPAWDYGKVTLVAAAHLMATYLAPFVYIAWSSVRFVKQHGMPAPEIKRTAILQRRGLFDFVSPFVVLVAVAEYLLFAAFVVYLQQQPFPGFGGYINLVGITLVYALNAGVVYMTPYGKKRNPFESHASRLHTIGLTVRSCIYGCIVMAAFLSLVLLLGLLDLRKWVPAATSTLLVVSALLASMGFASPLRSTGANGAGTDGQLREHKL